MDQNLRPDEFHHFIEIIQSINEMDYGDFMRKANHHLLELEEKISANQDPVEMALLADIKLHLQYSPNWNIAATRTYLTQVVALGLQGSQYGLH